MDNLKIYNTVREVPPEAKKNIAGGRLKGMTDINPMWRIKKLTEVFGVCGIGWKYEIVDRWIETAMAKDEITANVIINLYIKTENGEWSEPIPGIGGSMLVASETKGLYVNDECYKMALTDAISVACKALGMGADVYWNKDTTKYNDIKKDNYKADMEARASIEGEINRNATELASDREVKTFMDMCEKLDVDFKQIGKQAGATSLKAMTKEQYAKATIILKEIQDSRG